MKKQLLTGFALGLLLSGIAGTSHATAVTFFGEDITGRTNADLAHDSFMSYLTGTTTEDFEGFALGTGAPLTLDFASAGTATLSGNVGTVSDATASGRWATSGDQYWQADSGDFTITFDQDIAAFGFYGTDIGDWGGALTLTYSDGFSESLSVPHTIGDNGNTNAAVLFFGFLEDNINRTFRSISFSNSSSQDEFGFDDMTIGTLEQVNPVPEPATMLLFGCGLVGLATSRIRKKR